jgi:hypothetical protein
MTVLVMGVIHFLGSVGAMQFNLGGLTQAWIVKERYLRRGGENGGKNELCENSKKHSPDNGIHF